jgi:hypothetical protein
VSFLSDDYFSLVASQPELADAFALGERVIALSDGVAYEVVAADTAVQPLDLPPTPPPDESTDLPSNPTPATEPGSSIPASPLPSATPVASQPEPSSGPCASGLIPLLLLPLLAVLVKKRDRG